MSATKILAFIYCASAFFLFSVSISSLSSTDKGRTTVRDQSARGLRSLASSSSLRPVNVQPDVPSTNAGKKDNNGSSYIRINPQDSIYQRDWGMAAPIVIESHKLIFFPSPKVGCTIWKKLFRRMMGAKKWRNRDPHDPDTNGLKYLSDYSIAEAENMLNDPTWTRAIFVRDPKERLLSAYLDKVVGREGFIEAQCCNDGNCIPETWTFDYFVKHTVTTCQNDHWAPQYQRMEPQYWNTINFVGHLETVQEDSKQLLERIGAWEEFGMTKWGGANTRIFENKALIPHATSVNAEDSWSRLASYYTPELESMVESYFQDDYKHSTMEISMRKISYHVMGKSSS